MLARKRACVAHERRAEALSLLGRMHAEHVDVDVREDRRSQVFDPFFTTKPAGTGLGLSIGHAIVTAHGGRIALENAPGGGAAVTVLLPTKND